MLPILEHLAHATPTWLKDLNPSDIQQGPGPWIEHLTADALVYPGSGLDGSPVRQCNGVAHSFIFLDFGTLKPKVISELKRQRKTGTGFAHHHLVGLVEFDPTPFVANVDPCFINQDSSDSQIEHPYGIWAVYESNAPGPTQRFSFLFLGMEAIHAFASLYPTTAPRGLVVQEHGFGGNCWGNFSEQIMSLAEQWIRLPELLILGPNHQLGKWLGTAQTLGGDVATEWPATLRTPHGCQLLLPI